MSEVIVFIGAGQIGQALARRVSAGKHVLLADLHQENADTAAEVFANAGFDVSTATVLVTDIDWMHHLTDMFGWMTPGETKAFSVAEFDAALVWVAD